MEYYINEFIGDFPKENQKNFGKPMELQVAIKTAQLNYKANPVGYSNIFDMNEYTIIGDKEGLMFPAALILVSGIIITSDKKIKALLLKVAMDSEDKMFVALGV